MELKEFISATLVEIHLGVKDAINTLSEHDNSGAVNPIASPDGEMTSVQINEARKNVDFDIAVTTTSEDNINGNAGIKVMGLNLGGSGSTTATDSYVTRIKFSIPCIPPSTFVNPASPIVGGQRRR